MNEKELLPLRDLRQVIHDLTLMKRSTGLSPPDEKLLLQLESMELNLPEQPEDCSGFLIITRRCKE